MIDAIEPTVGVPLAVILWALVLAPVLRPAMAGVMLSQHHRSSKHTSATYHLRPEFEARLPLPCVECGKPVEKEQRWHIAHLTPASKGGRTTRQNTGVAHAMCNLKAGGKLGAKQTNTRRRSSSNAREGIRSW